MVASIYAAAFNQVYCGIRLINNVIYIVIKMYMPQYVHVFSSFGLAVTITIVGSCIQYDAISDSP